MNKDLDNYLYYSDVMTKISDSVYDSENDIIDILNVYYKELRTLAFMNYCNNDVLPYAVNTYLKILSKLPKQAAIESFTFMS